MQMALANYVTHVCHSSYMYHMYLDTHTHLHTYLVCSTGHAAAGLSTLFFLNYMQSFYWQSRMAVGHFPENYRQLAEGFSWTALDVT